MDDYSWIWETILIFYVGRILLRFAGRKSISQMTITQVIVMVGIGSLLIQPLADKNVFVTLAIGLLFTFLMVMTEYLEMKFDFLETISTGKAKIVIENGQINQRNLKKLRMSVDRLETRLRQSGISSIEDVKHATIEVSGQIGYELHDSKKPVTKEEYNLLLYELSEIKRLLGGNESIPPIANENKNLFEEIKTKNHEGRNEPS